MQRMYGIVDFLVKIICSHIFQIAKQRHFRITLIFDFQYTPENL